MKKKSRIAAAALAFFLGAFGVHKFYLNKPGEAMIFIFLLMTGLTVLRFPISALLGFFDAFNLLNMSDEKFDEKYNGQFKNTSQRRSRSSRDIRSSRRATSRRRSTPQSQAPLRRRSANNFSKSNPFKKSGIAKYKDFDLDGAIADFKQGLAISEGDVALHWNIACAYSLTEKKDKAYYHLARAVQLGFNDFEKIQTHDDLAYLRIQPEFEEFKADGYRTSPILKSRDNDPKQIATPNQEEQLTDDILLSQLNKLAELRKKGLLSEEEFAMERKKLLRR